MRQLVIFAVYLDVRGHSDAKSRTILHDLYQMLNDVVDEDLQLKTVTIIRWIMLGVRDQETKIECIYPVKSNELGDEILERLGLLAKIQP